MALGIGIRWRLTAPPMAHPPIWENGEVIDATRSLSTSMISSESLVTRCDFQ